MEKIAAIPTVILALGSLAWLLTLIDLVYKRIFRGVLFDFKDTVLLRFAEPHNRVVVSLIIIFLLFIYIVSSNFFLSLVGSHNLNREPAGTYSYYVQISKSRDDNIAYTLPASITVVIEEYDDGETSRKYRVYKVNRVFYDDGSYLEFSYNDSESMIDKASILEDQNGTEWYIKILNRHAYSPYVNESSRATTLTIIENVIIIFAVLYNWLGYLRILDRRSDGRH